MLTWLAELIRYPQYAASAGEAIQNVRLEKGLFDLKEMAVELEKRDVVIENGGQEDLIAKMGWRLIGKWRNMLRTAGMIENEEYNLLEKRKRRSGFIRFST